MAIIANIREIDRLCRVNLQRVNVPGRRDGGMGTVQVEIPRWLAKEALAETQTQADAEWYVMDHVDDIRMVWPEDLESAPDTKCGGMKRQSRN